MKPASITITAARRLSIAVLFLFIIGFAPACSHDSNSEDDTFRQSIVDDPARANRKYKEAKTQDSVRLGDTAITDESKKP